jgi:hypothetical protein
MTHASSRYPLQEALKAQQGLREAAGLPPEEFSIEQFVGMISDEVEVLRQQGMSDEEIARLIQRTSAIRISAADIEQSYASAEQRHPLHE